MMSYIKKGSVHNSSYMHVRMHINKSSMVKSPYPLVLVTTESTGMKGQSAN